MDPRERDVLERIEARRRRPRRKLKEDRITLAHGAGGRSTHDLVEALFLPELRNPALEALGDSALLAAGGGSSLAFSTDSSVVRPLFFPGGDIGELAVNGTVNDLAMAGARALGLSVGFVLEEGFEMDELRRIAASMGAAARRAGVPVVAGDTKVVERGAADGLYISTAGVGAVEADTRLSPATICAGDRVIVSGPLGDHGMAIMIARGELELEVDLESDTAPLWELVSGLLAATDQVRCMRDPTRGGLATVACELAIEAQLSIVLDEAALPVRPQVEAACEILGIDPLYVACEGRLVAVVGEEGVEAALVALRAHPLGGAATVIGEVHAEPPGMVLLDTAFGGTRVVDMLAGDPLPRIC